MPALSIASESQFGSFVQHMLVNNLVEVVRIADGVCLDQERRGIAVRSSKE